MTAVLIGSLTVGDIVPGFRNANAIRLAAAQQDLAVALAAVASINVQVGDPASLIASAVSFVASGQASAGLALVSPTDLLNALTANLSVNVGLTASLNSAIAGYLAIAAGFSVGGIAAYAIDSTAGATGSDLSAVLTSGLPGGGGSGAHVQGVLLLTESPTAFVALGNAVRVL